MKKYFENINEELKQYFNILSKEIPEFLYEYIETKEMQKQVEISISCGTIYSKMFNKKWRSSLDHSVGVALIVWNFTKDKKQTLAGLFHDIATPAFKHCIDFMNGDYEKQESTEELTEKIIRESEEIMALLNKDKIKLEEVSNYHIYPIADNNRPGLAADRLEYTFTDGFGGTEYLWNINEIKEIYENIEVLKNENGIDEIGFKNIKIAEKFVNISSKLSSLYIDNRTKYSMQFLVDILKKMNNKKIIEKNDLYKLSEKEIIEKIKKSEYGEIFNIWENSTKIKESDIKIEGKYQVNIENAKIRYIIPLVKTEKGNIRIDKISEKAKKDIENALNYKTKKYAYLDLNF